MDFLPKAHIPEREVRDLRDLLRHGAYLVRARNGLKNRVHAILSRYGIRHAFSDLFGKAGRAFLAELELRPTHQLTLEDNLLLVDALPDRATHQGSDQADRRPSPARGARHLADLHAGDRSLLGHADRRWPRSAISAGSRRPSSFAPTWAWCPPSMRVVIAPGMGASPKRAPAGSAGQWWKPPSTSAPHGVQVTVLGGFGVSHAAQSLVT